MPPSTRYTVRLPPALDALVQERLRTSGTPFAVFIQDALSAYLADTPPPGTPPPADTADTVRELQAQLAALTTRVEALEQGQSPLPTERRQDTDRSAARTPTRADRGADRAPISADTPQVHTRGGQRKLTPRQVRAMWAKRERGVPIKTLMEQYGVSRATLFRYLASLNL